MALSALKTAVTSRVGIQTLLLKKHSPAILFSAGMVGIGATIYLSARATLKVDEVLREAEKKKSEFDASIGQPLQGGGEYTEEDAKKDGLTNRVQLGIKIARLYAPAVLVGAATVGALGGSHLILNRRNAGLTAAYAAVDKGFKEYRARVVKEFGEDKDTEFRFGKVERQIGVDTDEGIVEKTVAGADPEYAESSGGRSIYARIFSEQNKNWSPYAGRNATFLRVQESFANDILTSKGYLILNDVYKMLGLGPTSAGAVVGWVRNNARGGDNHVSFGILDDEYEGLRFISGEKGSIWLDFNVDGVVYDLLDEVV